MQNMDFNWFVENHEKLFAEYGSSFIAIKNKTVLGVYDTYGNAVRETSQTEELGTFIVQRCGADESAYTCYISSMNFQQ